MAERRQGAPLFSPSRALDEVHMLSLSPPFHLIPTATDAGPVSIAVFRDHQRADVWYYLPPPPRLVTSADHPGFVLRRWRYPAELSPDGSRGGGFASFAIEAGLTAAQLGSLTSEVGRLTGNPAIKLLPVLFRSGTARLMVGHDEGEHRIVDLVGESPCSPVAPHRAAFALSLDPSGATLLKQAAELGDLPAAVHLDMQFEGLLPALRARATLNYERLYQRLGLALSGQYQCVRAELGAELAKAREDDDIHVEIIAFTDDEDRARKEAMVMALVQARVEMDFFKTAMPPKAGAANPLSGLLGGALGGGEPQASSAMFVLKARVEIETELKTFTLDFDARSAVRLTHVAASSLAGMIPPDARDMQDIDLDASFFRSLDVSVHAPPDFASMPDLRAVSVQIRAADRTAGFLFTPEQLTSQSFQVALGAGAPRRYEWKASFVFDPAASPELAEVSTEWAESEEPHLIPVVRTYVRDRRLRLATAVDWTRIRLVEVTVEAIDADRIVKTATFTLTEADDEAEFLLRRAASAPRLALKVRPRFVTTDGTAIEGKPENVTSDLYIAWNPVQELVLLTLVPAADWARVARVVVDLRRGPAGAETNSAYTFTSDTAQTLTVEIPIWAPEDHDIRWKQAVLFTDGTLATTEWAPADGTVIAVGATPSTDTPVRVFLLANRTDILAVRVSIEAAGAPPATAFFVAPFTPPPNQEVRVPLIQGTLDYHYQVWITTENGEQALSEGQDTRGVLVVKV